MPAGVVSNPGKYGAINKAEPMNTFESLDEILKNAVSVHRESVALYRSFSKKCVDSRALMLLGLMIDQGERLVSAIEKYRKFADESEANTRIQYSLELDPQSYVDSLTLKETSMDIEALSLVALNIFKYEIDLLDGAKRESSSERVHELLDNILQLEIAERNNFSKMVGSSTDM